MIYFYIGFGVLFTALFAFYNIAKEKAYFDEQIKGLKAKHYDYIEMSKIATDSKEKLFYHEKAKKISKEIDIILSKCPDLNECCTLPWESIPEDVNTDYIEHANWTDLIKHYAYNVQTPFAEKKENKVIRVDFSNKNRD